jgi:hypothetical protein
VAKVPESGPYEEQIRRWFARGNHGIAVICGNVSSHEVIDFDDPGAFERWRHNVAQVNTEVLSRVAIVATPRGGFHAHYRPDQTGTGEVLVKGPDGKRMVERKAEGGYVLLPGTPPTNHTEGRTYQQIAGPPLTELPVLTEAEHQALLDAARSLASSFPATPERNGQQPGPSPGDLPPANDNGLSPIERARLYLGKCDPAVSGEGGQDHTFFIACKLVGRSRRGFEGFGLSGEESLALLLSDFNPRCVPPWSEKDLRHKVEDALKQPKGQVHHPNDSQGASGGGTTSRQSKFQPNTCVYHGLAGRVVKAIEPHSEADPLALLVQLLAAFGNCIGRKAHFVVEGSAHFLNPPRRFPTVGRRPVRETARRMGAAGDSNR